MLSCFKRQCTKESFIDICKRLKNENKNLSASIVRRQNSKYQRDNISRNRQNRRFRRSRRRKHNRERTTIHKTNEKFVIQQAKVFCSEKKIQLTLAQKNSLTSNNLYCKKVLCLFQIQQILTGLI